MEYLAGRSSNRYQPTREFLNRRGRGRGRIGVTACGGLQRPIHNFERATPVVADSLGDTFRPGSLQRQVQGQGQYHSYLHQQQGPYQTAATGTDQISQSRFQHQTRERNDWGISEDAIPKIVELRRLLHSTAFPNPDVVMQSAKYFCMQGDNTFLEDKLAYLHRVDAIGQQQQQSGQDHVV
jgi:hypothetical protein